MYKKARFVKTTNDPFYDSYVNQTAYSTGVVELFITPSVEQEIEKGTFRKLEDIQDDTTGGKPETGYIPKVATAPKVQGPMGQKGSKGRRGR